MALNFVVVNVFNEVTVANSTHLDQMDHKSEKCILESHLTNMMPSEPLENALDRLAERRYQAKERKKTRRLGSFKRKSSAFCDDKTYWTKTPEIDSRSHFGERNMSICSIMDERSVGIASQAHHSQEFWNPLRKFMRVIKTINLVLKATNLGIKKTEELRQRCLTFTDIYKELEENLKIQKSEELSFDATDFKFRKEKVLNTEAINTLTKHKSLRSPEEIHFTILSLSDTVPMFSEYPMSMQEALVTNGWYERYKAKQVIIREGHLAKNFYFIISGKTTISKMRQNDNNKDTYGETVAFLKKGNSFGELALMYGSKRTASVICLVDVELLSLSRDNFIKIFMNLDDNTEPNHIKFVKSISLFEGWPVDLLPYRNPKICLLTFYRRGTVICKDSNASEWIYVICQGFCRVIKALKKPLGKQFHVQCQPLKVKSSVKDQTKKKNEDNLVYIQLEILKPGDVFGLESVAFEWRSSNLSVTLVSDGAECVAIDKGFFCQHMSESYLRKLRSEIQLFPDEEGLDDKLQNFKDWKSFQKAYMRTFLNQEI